jgi:hypothetical protein
MSDLQEDRTVQSELLRAFARGVTTGDEGADNCLRFKGETPCRSWEELLPLAPEPTIREILGMVILFFQNQFSLLFQKKKKSV